MEKKREEIKKIVNKGHKLYELGITDWENLNVLSVFVTIYTVERNPLTGRFMKRRINTFGLKDFEAKTFERRKKAANKWSMRIMGEEIL